MSKPSHPMCQKPDRDVPGIVCGYPLPCPFHTVIIDPEANAHVVPPNVRLTEKGKKRIAEVAKALKKGGK